MPAVTCFGAVVIVDRAGNFVDWKSLFDGFFHLLNPTTTFWTTTFCCIHSYCDFFNAADPAQPSLNLLLLSIIFTPILLITLINSSSNEHDPF